MKKKRFESTSIVLKNEERLERSCGVSLILKTLSWYPIWVFDPSIKVIAEGYDHRARYKDKELEYCAGLHKMESMLDPRFKTQKCWLKLIKSESEK